MATEICWVCGRRLPKSIIEKIGTPISGLGLSRRAENALVRGGVESVEQLLKLGRAKLLCLRSLGAKSAREIFARVREFGFNLEV